MKLEVLHEAINHEQFEVLKSMALAISHEEPDSHKIARVKAALFNHGVRQIGNIGDEVAFDTIIHGIVKGSPLPKDIVKIVKPGWRHEEAGITLLKAEVEGAF